jgi:heterodisulfide reductase subunit C/nitrate reductase gamma subunit
MFFSIALYVSLGLMALGLLYKLHWWFSARIGEGSQSFTVGQRAAAALGGLVKALASPRLLPMLKALVADGLFQRRSLAHSPLAWAGHMLMFWGFVLLLLMHALDKQISAKLFSDYASTLNPFIFLRNLFGIMVVAGVGITLWRRRKSPGLKMTTGAVDRLAIAVLAVIILSGFAVEALKITSQQRFQAMVKEYSTLDKPEDIQALEAYWAVDFGVVFGQGAPPKRDETWAKGRELNEAECAQCHSRPQWATASYGLSRLLSPVALALNHSGVDTSLWYLHFLACFAGLALLPWTKFLHLVTSPLLLMVRAAAGLKDMRPANQATMRALMIDACTHCGACSVHCSVAVAVRQTANLEVLPSEKLAGLKRLAAGGLAPEAKAGLRAGSHVCTLCHRCTRICPVGIDLQELWFALNQDLAAQGLGPAIAAAGAAAASAATPSRKLSLVKVSPARVRPDLMASPLAGTFSNCFRCVTCSNVCPVVRYYYPEPREHLDLLPHQIMHSLGLGLKEEAQGARMTWSCLTCYQCQEACPQGVRVADVLLELRNQASGSASGSASKQNAGPVRGGRI